MHHVYLIRRATTSKSTVTLFKPQSMILGSALYHQGDARRHHHHYHALSRGFGLG